MLDVHAPEHRLESVRDFFLHLFTITVGLLIALGLENAAEDIHHRHQRREAETNIRQELESNRKLLQDNGPQVREEGLKLLQVIKMLETRSAGGDLPSPGSLVVAFAEEPIPDSAWRTANTTGVLDYMDYKEAQRFADAYKQQDMLQNAEEQALENFFELSPFYVLHSKDLTPEQAKEALPFARAALAHVNAMYAIGAGTLQSYNQALK